MNRNSNKLSVPEAKAAMERFKMEAANEVGVNLKEGYNGDLTARQAGSVGGQMVNDMCTEGQMVHKFTRPSRNNPGYSISVTYISSVSFF